MQSEERIRGVIWRDLVQRVLTELGEKHEFE
jgi:hypothetical protein